MAASIALLGGRNPETIGVIKVFLLLCYNQALDPF